MPENQPKNTLASAESSAVALAGLTEKQAAFCCRYVTENNASLAAREAGYSPRTAAQIGHKLLKRPSITRALQALRVELAESETVAPAAVLARMKAQALTDPSSLLVKRSVPVVNQSGIAATDPETGAELAQTIWAFREPDELSPDQRALVASCSLNTRTLSDGTIRQTIAYKTVDSQRALADLAKALGLNSETVEHSHSGHVSHSVAGMFRFIADNPANAETTARISGTGRDGRRRPVILEHGEE